MLWVDDEAVAGGAGLFYFPLSFQTPSGDDEQYTKAEVRVAVAGGDELPESRAAELRRPVPRAATDRAFDAGTSRRVFHRAVLVIIGIVIILTPLPRIAVHVIKSPCVRLQLAHT